MIYAVIGLGKFGSNVAKDLLMQKEKVVIADKNEKKLHDFKSLAYELYILDSTDVDALKESGISTVDTAIVSIGENVESSILTVMALKEVGVKEIIAKAVSLVHGKILSKIGVSRVVYPERDSARRLVKNIVQNPACEIIEITNTLRLARLNISAKLTGLSVEEALKPCDFCVNIVGIKDLEVWDFLLEKDKIIKGDKILIIGQIKAVEEFIKMYEF